MNQTQRQFLLSSIESQYKAEIHALRKSKPVEPSLNNYLVASILDGTFKMKDQGAVREAIRERTIKLGKKEALLCGSTDVWGHCSLQDEDTEEKFIKVPVGIIFELPERYISEKKKYDSELEEWTERERLLTSSFEAMKIKVQLGSDKALQSLVDQADSLCSMSLTDSSKLFITNTK